MMKLNHIGPVALGLGVGAGLVGPAAVAEEPGPAAAPTDAAVDWTTVDDAMTEERFAALLDGYASTAEALGTNVYAVMHGDGAGAALIAGDPLFGWGDDLSEVIEPGETLRPGVWVNFSPTQAVIGGGDQEIRIEPGSFIAVTGQRPPDDRADSCSVTCGGDTFACCTYSDNNRYPTCVCKPNGTSADCDAGGPGATSCSLRQSNSVPGPEDPSGPLPHFVHTGAASQAQPLDQP